MELDEITQGFFVDEEKNRFLGKVIINGKLEMCYIASSSHLKPLIELKNKEVLLIPVESKKAKTKYCLYAVKNNNDFIIVNTNVSNYVIRNSLKSSKFDFLGLRTKINNEYKLDNYKCDIFIGDSNTIIEIKTLISTNTRALFPNIYSERFKKQLEQINKYLINGFRVYLFIISFGKSSEIVINHDSKNGALLQQCIDNGLHIFAYSCELDTDKRPKISDDKIIISY